METFNKMETATKDTLTVLPETVQDDYTASIELSNACREFYTNRLKATESFKQNLGSSRATGYRRTSIDDAMEKLRNEMASLMDQDLSLMKQLLTLNEAIEDLKVKRLYHVSKDSLRASSQELHVSDWSVSETDMFDSEDNLSKKVYSKPVSSTHSLPVSPLALESSSSETKLEVSKTTTNEQTVQRKCDIKIMVNGAPLKVRHGPQNSLDSGYGGDDDHYTHSNASTTENDRLTTRDNNANVDICTAVVELQSDEKLDLVVSQIMHYLKRQKPVFISD